MNRREKLDVALQRVGFFETILKSMTDGLLIIDSNNQILETNYTFCSFFGLQRQEIIETNIYDLMNQIGHEAIDQWAHVSQVLNTQKKYSNIIFSTKIMGDEVFYSVNASVIERIADRETQAVVTVWREITEQVKTRRIEQFLYTLLNHDIQNKNMTIIAYLTLLQGENLQERAKNFVSKALDSVQRSSDLLKKIRHLKKVRYSEEVTPTMLQPIFISVLDEYSNLAEEKEIEIEYTQTKVSVQGGILLRELFSNLIENSIIHSQCNKIRISVQENHISTLIVIEDDGNGIPDNLHDNLFKEGAKGISSSGSGLGMFLVKQIVESYKGTIQVGESEMGGVRFEIRLETA